MKNAIIKLFVSDYFDCQWHDKNTAQMFITMSVPLSDEEESLVMGSVSVDGANGVVLHEREPVKNSSKACLFFQRLRSKAKIFMTNPF